MTNAVEARNRIFTTIAKSSRTNIPPSVVRSPAPKSEIVTRSAATVAISAIALPATRARPRRPRSRTRTRHAAAETMISGSSAA
jgi:hypothetical protein